VYQQQLIEELISENSTLKQDLQSAESKLKKVESQLTKTKQWIRDLGNIKEDIQTLNLKADQVEEYESLTTENEILKSKIQDLETRVNTLSRAGEDQRVDDKGRFERIIQTITDENRLVTEKYRMCQQAMMKQDEEIIKWKSLCQQRDQEIVILHSNWKQLHEDFSNSVKEYKVLQQHNDELRNMARNQAKNEQAMKNQFRVRNEPRSDHSSQRDES
jgi:predicted  nucleic acid-binding Zn-ribbon protein